jgi:hypothetical protein
MSSYHRLLKQVNQNVGVNILESKSKKHNLNETEKKRELGNKERKEKERILW